MADDFDAVAVRSVDLDDGGWCRGTARGGGDLGPLERAFGTRRLRARIALRPPPELGHTHVERGPKRGAARLAPPVSARKLLLACRPKSRGLLAEARQPARRGAACCVRNRRAPGGGGRKPAPDRSARRPPEDAGLGRYERRPRCDVPAYRIREDMQLGGRPMQQPAAMRLPRYAAPRISSDPRYLIPAAVHRAPAAMRCPR